MVESARDPRTAGMELPRPWQLPEGVRQTFEIVHLQEGVGYIAGHGPVDDTQILMHGKVGEDLTVEDGYQSARLTGLAIAASLARVVPSLDCISWLRATVYVNAVPGLGGPALTRVADGFSDAINDIFRYRGRHARATVGATALAFNVPTIVEGMVAVNASSD